MASKYAHLKGKVPPRETVRGEAVTALIRDYSDLPKDEATQLYNDLSDQYDYLEAWKKTLSARLEALEVVLMREMNAEQIDSMRLHGYTWFESCTPYPVADDPEAIVKYFKDNGMEDQLELSKTELVARLKRFVAAEAENNELTIEIKQVEGGEPVTEVRSQIPGVKVYLDRGISRRKSSKE